MATVLESKNAWRAKSGAPKEWGGQLQSGAANKYFIVSADAHINEPMDFLSSRVDKKFHDRLPRLKVDEDGTQWLLTDGWGPQPVKIASSRRDLMPTAEEFESYEVLNPYTDRMEDEDVLRAAAGRDLAQRMRHCAEEGVDAEIVFPQKGLLAFATPEPEFAGQMCRAWNRWAKEALETVFDRVLPMALIATGDVDAAIKEVQWAAANGFHGVLLPNRPIFSRVNEPRHPPEYNDKCFEPLWAAIAETGLPITFHVSTGQDPRAVGGNGGAIINMVSHSVTTTMEPLVQIIASGVLERHRSLKVAAIESGIGWIHWMLTQMDLGYRAHHMWVRPVIPNLPSEYFRESCYATFVEEPDALDMCVALGLEDNLMWSNDYPHHEGSFPHSTVTIERSMGSLTDVQRRKVLGGNAAKLFKIKGYNGVSNA